ncbi:MAG: flavin reductase family protein [Solirubrobacteraceae bacterium]
MDDQNLVDSFQAGTIDGNQFPHERHVRVAWGLARRYGRDEGLRRLVTGIRAMAARAGRPEAYHETITRAWYELIAGVDDLAGAPELFDKRLLGRFYSSERLAAGRSRWLEPDLRPLSLSARSNQFKSVPHRLSPFGPELDNAAAWMGCRMHAIHDCGDHRIVVGEVVNTKTTGSHPLLRHQGSYL